MPRDAGRSLLLDALVDLDRAQTAWLADLRGVLPGDTACTVAMSRWEERLSLTKLCLHRAEQRLLGSLVTPVALPIDPGRSGKRDTGEPARRQHWREAFEGWFTALHLPSTFRRLESCLDLDQEAVHADIITDFSILAEVAESASIALASLSLTPSRAELEDLAFYRILAPWRRRGVPALLDVLRWLSETLQDREEW